MSKKQDLICPICRQEVKKAFALNNGEQICKECAAQASFSKAELLLKDASTIAENIRYFEDNHRLFETMNVTKKLGVINMGVLCCDEARQLWYYSTHTNPKKYSQVFSYSEITELEYTENGTTVTKGGLGGAVIGGAMFGVAGAIVGSNVSKKASSSVLTSMAIKVSLKNAYTNQLIIEFIPIGRKVNSSSILYKSYKDSVDKVLAQLRYMQSCSNNETTEQAAEPLSIPEQIKQYKELLDIGAITQDEYDRKKSELLGL